MSDNQAGEYVLPAEVSTQLPMLNKYILGKSLILLRQMGDKILNKWMVNSSLNIECYRENNTYILEKIYIAHVLIQLI